MICMYCRLAADYNEGHGWCINSIMESEGYQTPNLCDCQHKEVGYRGSQIISKIPESNEEGSDSIQGR